MIYDFFFFGLGVVYVGKGFDVVVKYMGNFVCCCFVFVVVRVGEEI